MGDSEVMTTEQLYGLIQRSNEEQTIKITTEIRKAVFEVTKRVIKAEEKIEALTKRNISLERRIRKNNIVIFGLSYVGSDLAEFVIDQFNKLLKIVIKEEEINNIYKIGKKSESQPIVIEFVSYFNKLKVLKNTKLLKDTTVSIANDLCPEDREDLKVLVKHLKIAKANNIQAKIRGLRLVINGKEYTVEQLQQIQEEIDTGGSDDEDTTDREVLIGKEGEEEDNTKQTSQETKRTPRSKKRKRTGKKISPKFLERLRSRENKK